MKKQTLINKNNEFENIINDLITNDTVLKLKNFTQHFGTCRFQHCYSVAYYCYIICKKLNLNYVSATRAAMLHDLFFYECRDKNSQPRFHIFNHSKTACENACKLFSLSKMEQNMIITHMWPVTLTLPTSTEGFILTFVDKYCATLESWHALKLFIYSKKFFRYAYLFLVLPFLNINII